jgi:hypothetical protein
MTTRASTRTCRAPAIARRRSGAARSVSPHSVESVFSTLKNRGVGGKGNQRLKLVGDPAADWVIGLAALHLTAARVAHAVGGYDDSYAAAECLGYLTEPTAENPFPQPTIDEQSGPPRAIRRRRRSRRARCIASSSLAPSHSCSAAPLAADR